MSATAPAPQARAKRVALYPGTFDPMTLGHEDIVRRASALFDEVLIAVARAHHKKTLFSLQERLEMAQEVAAQWPGVRVLPFEGLVTRFAREHGAQVMVRGLRSGTDFDYEYQLADMNSKLAPEVETVLLLPNAQYQSISSTLVREITLLDGAAAQFVSPPIWQRLLAKKAVRAVS